MSMWQEHLLAQDFPSIAIGTAEGCKMVVQQVCGLARHCSLVETRVEAWADDQRA